MDSCKKIGLILLVIVAGCNLLIAQPLNQKQGFTHQDTLRGSINAERSWWNAIRYDIEVNPDFVSKNIKGTNTISFEVLQAGSMMQIDLQEPMAIESIALNNKIPLTYMREGNVYHIKFPRQLKEGTNQNIKVYFSGKPRQAIRPPWDGGWIFQKDKKGRPWMSVACQGLGASVWYPCKDHQSDEPDKGASLTMTVPDTLVAVANGRLLKDKSVQPGYRSFTWEVRNPINNYNIIPYIGKYVHWKEEYAGEKGKLDCDYWVLDYEEEKAKIQFKQVPLMLKSFEFWFGPYPFYEDGYKLVQSPHLGMEHQSAVAYGNGFQNGYLGRDLSGSGWGKKWDFIIIHESCHEWFANNITTNDLADMWVHEGFTNYSETLFTTSEYGVEAGNDYVIGTRKLIQNDIPIIGIYGVNQEGSGDMYYKGGNLIHTIRNCIGNDEKFRQILRGLNKKYYHSTVDSKQVEDFISEQASYDFTPVFNQYLRNTSIPVFEYKLKGKDLSFRFSNCIAGFHMPITIKAGKAIKLVAGTEWKQVTLDNDFAGDSIEIDRNFYVKLSKLE